MVTAYLDLAESMALRNMPMTMADWEIRLNGFLTLMDHEVLKDKGKVSAEEAKIYAEKKNVYTDAKQATYGRCVSQLILAKAQAAVQVTEYASFAEKITNLKDIKALTQQAQKWIKNGNGFSDADKDAVRQKVEDIRSKTKPRDMNNFEKNLPQLFKIVGL